LPGIHYQDVQAWLIAVLAAEGIRDGDAADASEAGHERTASWKENLIKH